ncbi:transposase [bacterium]|nr:transposase [bacterium]
MARPLRIEYPDAMYHITSRGDGKKDIFRNDNDRNYFINLLSEIKSRYRWKFYAYCLMPNHYHLLVETPEGNLSRGMRHLNGLYTQFVNRQYNSCGHLFQGRYKSIIVEKDSYYFELSRYIVLNPVRAGLTKYPDKYVWSSYNSVINSRKNKGLIERKELLQIIGGSSIPEAIKRYIIFVEEGIGEKSPLENLNAGFLLGSVDFIDKVLNHATSKRNIRNVKICERLADRPSLEEIFLEQKNINERNCLIYKAFIDYEYKLQEIGDYLSLHYSTISRKISEQKNKKIKSKDS